MLCVETSSINMQMAYFLNAEIRPHNFSAAFDFILIETGSLEVELSVISDYVC
jgi:hypothetical protein